MVEVGTTYNTFTLPITRSGKSQVVPPPPWIYGIEMIGVKAYFEQSKLKDLVPPPLDIVDGEDLYMLRRFILLVETDGKCFMRIQKRQSTWRQL